MVWVRRSLLFVFCFAASVQARDQVSPAGRYQGQAQPSASDFSQEVACGYALYNSNMVTRHFTELRRGTLGFRGQERAGTRNSYYAVTARGAVIVRQSPDTVQAFRMGTLDRFHPSAPMDIPPGEPANDGVTRGVILDELRTSIRSAAEFAGISLKNNARNRDQIKETLNEIICKCRDIGELRDDVEKMREKSPVPVEDKDIHCEALVS